MLRKQVVLLTSAIFTVILATTTVVWIQNAEADISVVRYTVVTHHCVDSNSGHPWNDICQTVKYIEITIEPELHGHGFVAVDDEKQKFTSVSKCSKCPNPPFTNYN